MWSASNTFKEKAVDGFSPQNVVMVFNDLFFSANDGDFAESGITWNGYFNTAEDLTYGEAPSDTESFSLINDNGVLASFEYGVEQTYFGVQTDSESFSLPNGDNCYIEYDGDTYEGKSDGLYVNGTKSSAVAVAVFGLLGYGGKVYAIGDGESVVIDTALGTASEYSPNRFIVDKFKGGKSAVFDVSTYTATVWYLNSVDTWEYAPMGVYQVKRPEQNLADIVRVTDAHDYMTLFDHDAAEFLASVSYPTTVAFLYESLCDWVGVDYETSVFPRSDTSFDASPFPDTSTTLRQVLKWIAEKAFCIAHFDREGILCLHWLGSSVAEEVGANNVSWKNLSIAEYAVAPVTNAILKDIAGNTITYESGDNPYVVAGNPFISTITAADLAEFRALPEYVPLTVDVIYPDPCTDMGDIVSVQPNEDVRRMLTDAYSRALINEDEEAFAYEISPFVMPLMERTLTFNGWLSGRYVSRGNRKRLYDVDSTAYNASLSFAERVEKTLTPVEVFNKLTDNGRIQGLYMVDGQIYINAEYIKSGKISAIDLEGVNIIGSTFAAGRIITINGSDYTQSDLHRIYSFIAGDDVPTEADYEHLDVNQDGEINIIDASYILNAMNNGQYTIDARLRIDGDALTNEIVKVGNFTKIGNNSINTNIYNGNSVDVQNIIAKEMTVGEPTASTPYYISSSSSAIQLVCGGHVLSVDSTGVKVDGRSI